jgi:hypothetical protein
MTPTILDIITRDERLGYSDDEQRYLVEQYILERTGSAVDIRAPRDPRTPIGGAMFLDYVSDLAKLFNHALLWYQINYKHN